MRSSLARLVLMGAGLTAAGCGVQTGWMMLNPAPRPLKARPADEVQMFTGSQPTRPFVEHGLVTTGISVLGPGELAQLAALKEEAAKHGCDAVVITGENKMAQSGGSHGVATERTYAFRAICAVFTDVSADVTPTSAPVTPTSRAAAATQPSRAACKSHLECKGPFVCAGGECVAPTCMADKECGAGRGCSLEGQCEPIASVKPAKRLSR